MIRIIAVVALILGGTHVSLANTSSEINICTQQCVYQKGEDRRPECHRACVEELDQ